MAIFVLRVSGDGLLQIDLGLLELLLGLEYCAQFDQGQRVSGKNVESLFKGDYRQTVFSSFERPHALIVGYIHGPAQIAIGCPFFVLGSIGSREASVNLGVESVLMPSHVVSGYGVRYLAFGEQSIAMGKVFLWRRRSV